MLLMTHPALSERCCDGPRQRHRVVRLYSYPLQFSLSLFLSRAKLATKKLSRRSPSRVVEMMSEILFVVFTSYNHEEKEHLHKKSSLFAVLILLVFRLRRDVYLYSSLVSRGSSLSAAARK